MAVPRNTKPRSGAAAAVVLVLSLLAMLSGCGESRPGIGPLPQGAVILAFGDSLTHGTGAGQGEDYPSQLAALTGQTVINAGVPGETTDRGLARLPSLLERHRPDLVIICHGGNDILRNHDEAATETNLRRMIETIRAAGARVLLLGVPRKSLFLSTAPLYQRLADDMKVAYAGDIIGDVLGDGDLKSDAIHPNAEGYRTIADHLAELVR